MSANFGYRPQSLPELYEELVRVKNLLEYYALEYHETDEPRTVAQLFQLLWSRERQIVLRIIELEKQL